jgi:Na+/melibiose symporter-like transporter
MNMRRLLRLAGVIGFVMLASLVTWASTTGTTARDAGDGGASAVWIFANLSFAGMRAQNSSSKGWRIIAFIFGFPGTLLSLFVVEEGGERVYGIEMPRRKE